MSTPGDGNTLRRRGVGPVPERKIRRLWFNDTTRTSMLLVLAYPPVVQAIDSPNRAIKGQVQNRLAPGIC
jgi:hypothetical protein